MTDTPRHSPFLKRTQEQQSERNTAMEFSNAITQIGLEYSKCQEPKSDEAKKLALKQLQEQEDKFNEYKKTPHGQRAIAEFEKDVSCSVESMVIGDMNTNLRDARILISWDRESILRVISEHIEGDSVLVFLPKEYMENGKISKKTQEATKEQIKKDEVKRFIDGESVGIPYFTNEEFEKYADILKPALAKPGTILRMYEWMNISSMEERSRDMKKQSLTENPLFIATINDILIKEYPFFKDANESKWYKQGGMNFGKINTLLNVTRYQSNTRGDFIDMMNDAENGDSEKALGTYEKYYIGTTVGIGLRSHFSESKLLVLQEKSIQKTVVDSFDERKRDGKKTSDIYSILETKDGKSLATNSFIDIPKRHLSSLLSSISMIEEKCSTGDTATLIRELDPKNIIDPLYKQIFFMGLSNLTSLGNIETRPKKWEFYWKMIKHYMDQIDVTEEMGKVEKTENRKSLDYTIINRAFPWTENIQKREQKNEEFKHFLTDKSLIEDGQIKVSRDELIDRLSIIFEGTQILQDIKKSKDGKEIFKILSESFKEEEKHQETSLKSMGFDIDQWNDFQKKDILKANEIRSKLSSPETSLEEKRAILTQFFKNPTKVPTDPEEIKNLIKELQTHTHMTRTVRNFEQTKENLADFSQAWQSGNFTEFNKKTQEREQKREEAEIKKQQEQKEKQGEPNMKSSTAIPFDSKTNYSEIPVGQIMTLGNDTFIHKDSSNTVSVFSQGITIDKIQILDEQKPLEDINKAISSIQFLKESGLDVFRNDISRIIDAVNDRASRGSGTKIDIANGLSVEEGLILLETIGKITQEKVEIKTRDDSQLNALKRQFSMEGGGFLSKLQNTWYAKSDQIDVEKITKSIKTMT